MAVDLSVIIPTLNEGHRIQNTIEQTRLYLTSRGFATEILIVDGNSRDKTKEIVEGLMPKIPNLRLITQEVNIGKGDAVRRGMLSAKGDLRLFMDADLSTPIEELERLLEPLRQGFDAAIGSRGLKESQVLKAQPFYRQIPGKFFGSWARFWTGLPFHDTQCGFKLFTAKAAQEIFIRQKCPSFAFDVEILYIALALDCRVCEVPVRWTHAAPSKARVLISGWRSFWTVARIPSWHPKRKFPV